MSWLESLRRRWVSGPTGIEQEMRAPEERGAELARISMLVEEWASMADWIDGYHMNVDEYWNDMAVREALESYLARPDTPEWVHAEVARIDALAREVLQPGFDDPRWWIAMVPKRAGQQLADDLSRWTDVHIEVVETW